MPTSTRRLRALRDAGERVRRRSCSIRRSSRRPPRTPSAPRAPTRTSTGSRCKLLRPGGVAVHLLVLGRHRRRPVPQDRRRRGIDAGVDCQLLGRLGRGRPSDVDGSSRRRVPERAGPASHVRSGVVARRRSQIRYAHFFDNPAPFAKARPRRRQRLDTRAQSQATGKVPTLMSATPRFRAMVPVTVSPASSAPAKPRCSTASSREHHGKKHRGDRKRVRRGRRR